MAYKRKYRFFIVSSEDADTRKFESFIDALRCYKYESSATLYGDEVDGELVVIYSK